MTADRGEREGLCGGERRAERAPAAGVGLARFVYLPAGGVRGLRSGSRVRSQPSPSATQRHPSRASSGSGHRRAGPLGWERSARRRQK